MAEQGTPLTNLTNLSLPERTMTIIFKEEGEKVRSPRRNVQVVWVQEDDPRRREADTARRQVRWLGHRGEGIGK